MRKLAIITKHTNGTCQTNIVQMTTINEQTEIFDPADGGEDEWSRVVSVSGRLGPELLRFIQFYAVC